MPSVARAIPGRRAGVCGLARLASCQMPVASETERAKRGDRTTPGYRDHEQIPEESARVRQTWHVRTGEVSPPAGDIRSWKYGAARMAAAAAVRYTPMLMRKPIGPVVADPPAAGAWGGCA